VFATGISQVKRVRHQKAPYDTIALNTKQAGDQLLTSRAAGVGTPRGHDRARAGQIRDMNLVAAPLDARAAPDFGARAYGCQEKRGG
jgi:hypothetical protein